MDGQVDGKIDVPHLSVPRENLVSKEPFKQGNKPGNPVLFLELFIKNTKWHNCKK